MAQIVDEKKSAPYTRPRRAPSLNHENVLLPRSQAAIDRLEQAVNRLEGSLGRPVGDLFGKSDRSVSRDDYARLDQTARLVEARLDSVIDRLKTILED
jgi:hypothetical protein